MNDRIPGSSPFNPIKYRGFDIFAEEHPIYEGTWFCWIRTVPDCQPHEEQCGNAWTVEECKQDIDQILGANDNR